MTQKEKQIIKKCIENMKTARDMLNPFCFRADHSYPNANTMYIFNRLNTEINQYTYCLELEGEVL